MSNRRTIERKKPKDVEPSARVTAGADSLVVSSSDNATVVSAASSTEVHHFGNLPVLNQGDRAEVEADEMAASVVGSDREATARRRDVSRTPVKVAADSPVVANSTADRIESVVNSGGQPLDPSARAFMEPRFGHSFSDVRIHADSRAADSAALVHARAYTLGRNIVFGAREFAPATDDGRRLLAHELTHVIQQTSESTGSESATGQRAIQREPNASIAPPTPAPMSTTPPPAPPPTPASPGSAPPNMGGTSAPAHQGSAQSVRVKVTTGEDPEYSSNSRNTGSGTITLSANAEETYASLRALGAADMWNMACVVGNLSRWAATAPDPAPDTSPGGSGSVQIANANPADTAYDDNYRAAFPHFKGQVQTFYKRFKDFQTEFKEHGTQATLGLIQESRARTKRTLEELGITPEVEHERGPVGQEYNTTYKSDSAKNKAMSEAAAELLKKQEALEKLLKKREDLRGVIHWATTSNDTIDKEEKEIDKQIDEARPAWLEEKHKARKEYPVLSHFETSEQLKQLSNPASAAFHVGSKLNEILANIQELEEKLKAGNDRILTLPEHLSRLADAFNLNEFERRTVTYMREKHTGDIETGQRVATLIAIVLAAIAAAPTAGGSLVALAAVGEAAINTTLLLQAYDQYSFEKAATGSSEEKAEALSQDDPSLFWLAFQFVSTVAGLGGNAKVVMTELRATYREITAAYKAAATTGQTAQLEGVLAAQKIPKEASAGIVARAVKDSVAVLEGIAKGGPEGLQAALDLLKGSPNFYGVRLAVWRLKAGANVAQATQNLQAARQQVINKIVEDSKAKYPKATFAVVDQGFERPIIIKIGSAPDAPPPSVPPPSSAPAPPASTVTPGSAKPDELPPGVTGPPVKLPDKGVFVQTQAPGSPVSQPPAAPDASPMGPAVPPPAPSPLGASVAAPAAPSPAAQGTGTVVPSGNARPFTPPPVLGNQFHPPMEISDATKQALAAAEELQTAGQAAFGGVPAAAGADATIQLGESTAPFGPMSLEQQTYYGARNLAVPQYSGLYLTARPGQFALDADMTQKFMGSGTSGKLILRDSTNAKQLYMFKPAGAEAHLADAYVVQPGTYFVRGRAAYDIGMNLPTISSDIVPMGVVVYEGRVGSLQPFVKNSETLADLQAGTPKNTSLTPEMAEKMYKKLWEEDAQFAKFRENIRAYDHIINNPDRNKGNFIVEFNEDLSVKRFFAIDQDLALTPGARTIKYPHQEHIPHGSPSPFANMPPGSGLEQKYLGKISKTMYEELLQMRVNQVAVKESLMKIYGLSEPSANGVLTRLGEVVDDYAQRLKDFGPEATFAD